MDLILEITKLLKKMASILENIQKQKFAKYYELIEDLAKSKRWKRVLNEIVEYAPHQYAYKVGENHELLKKLKMSSTELDLCIEFLECNGLITCIKKEDSFGNIGLTKEGFNVSFEIEKIESEKRFRTYTIIISVIAIIISVIAIIISIYKILMSPS